MPVKQNCSICKEHTYQYKCPGCLALYCSVSCYKEHKVTCTNVAVDKDNAPQIPLIHNNLTPDIAAFKFEQTKFLSFGKGLKAVPDDKVEADMAERLKEPDYELDTEETEDRVPREQLDLLGQSVELKAMLNNPHLREMLMALIKTDSPATKLDAAMQEPIFTEFADKCLAVINNNDENKDSFEIEDL